MVLLFPKFGDLFVEAVNLSFLEPISIDHCCLRMAGNGLNVLPVNMDVTMEMVAGFEGLDQPAERLNALMRQVGFIMDAPGWCMADENIQEASAAYPVQNQPRGYAQDVRPHL